MRLYSIARMSSTVAFDSLENWLKAASNTAAANLIDDGIPYQSPHVPREVLKAHISFVKPVVFPSPKVVVISSSCAELLRLPSSVLTTNAFRDLFVGAALPPPLDRPYATVYGCHCYGHYFGQLGDGRALTLGEVDTSQG